jgi:tRNA pseudouridine synthase 10
LSKDATPDKVKFLSTLKDLVIEQKTPIRVLHRRSAATRKKIIYTLNGEWLDSRHILLDLVTQAGTYVKEFVHGDFGRTHPNVGSLLNCEADLLLLDCVGIDFDFPPKLSNSTRNFEREYNIANIVDEWRALSTQSTPFSCK